MRTETEILDATELCLVMMDQINFEIKQIGKEGANSPRSTEDLKLARRITDRVADVLAWVLGNDGEFENRVAAFRASRAAMENRDCHPRSRRHGKPSR